MNMYIDEPMKFSTRHLRRHGRQIKLTETLEERKLKLLGNVQHHVLRRERPPTTIFMTVEHTLTQVRDWSVSRLSVLVDEGEFPQHRFGRLADRLPAFVEIFVVLRKVGQDGHPEWWYIGVLQRSEVSMIKTDSCAVQRAQDPATEPARLFVGG